MSLDQFVTYVFIYIMWILVAVLFSYSFFGIRKESFYYKHIEIRFYFSFPKMCQLTIIGKILKYGIIYPLVIIWNLIYWIIIWPVWTGVPIVHIIAAVYLFSIELFQVYRDFFKYIICKDFKASDIHCYRY